MDIDSIRNYFLSALISIPSIIPALVLHEYAHGWASDKLGDPTAKNMGRLTLDPMKHLDLFGTIAILVMGFGWAKPTPINPSNYKNRKKGIILVSFAGPAANLLLAFITSFLYNLIQFVFKINPGIGNDRLLNILALILFYGINININLFLFNLLPLPPLDGSQIISAFSSKIRNFFSSHGEGISSIFLILILMFHVLDFYLIFAGSILFKIVQFIPEHLFGL